MLRRPPTRIPLKTDDIEEYEEILKERREQELAENPNKSSESFVSQRATNAKRKKNAAERIGLKR